ncbi:hypothetical protein C4588_00675 [Candidatus Parcubacteria bacterium]|nr:MAG: hypothetical protein C4588_00675 [Candidatus Parcubacteria bacterium]
MNSSLEEITPPISELVEIPYDIGTFLHQPTLTRWYKNADNELIRDLPGEEDWTKMGAYVGKSYEIIFMETLKRCLNRGKNGQKRNPPSTSK